MDLNVWWIGLIVVVIVLAVAIVVARSRAAERRERWHRQQRYNLEDTGQRVPLAEPAPDAPPGAPIGEMGVGSDSRRAPTLLETLRAEELSDEPLAASPESSPPAVLGRIVDTPDGEMVLTTPPFALREAILTSRAGRYFNRLSRRVPPWVVCCPKVRLESLLTPTAPDNRNAADWAAWRRRVRWRSVDIVLVDRRAWRPILAIVFRVPANRPVARALAGDQDRMLDEVFITVGLPFVRVSGAFEQDWALILPHIEQAILPTTDDEAQQDVRATAEPISPEAAVNLLKLDEDKGWLLG